MIYCPKLQKGYVAKESRIAISWHDGSFLTLNRVARARFLNPVAEARLQAHDDWSDRAH